MINEFMIIAYVFLGSGTYQTQVVVEDIPNMTVCERTLRTIITFLNTSGKTVDGFCVQEGVTPHNFRERGVTWTYTGPTT